MFAQSCAEALQILETIQGVDADAPYSRTGEPVSFPRDTFRFAIPSRLEFHGDKGYETLYWKAIDRLKSLGGEAHEIDYAPFLEVQQLLYGPWVAERTAVLEKYLDQMLPVTRGIVESGRRYSASDAFKAQYQLSSLKSRCEALLTGMDVMVVPGAPTIYRIAEVEREPVELNSRLGRYTNFVNLLDMAAITVPAGFREDGIPFGITLIGPAFSDRALATLGARFTGEKEIPGGNQTVMLAVVGAHLSGMPLNHQLTERGARLIRAARTAPAYRLFALEGKPGMVRMPGSGARIEVEVWEMPASRFGSFVALVPPPLGIGTIELENGELAMSFLCEHYAVADRPDITPHGGWRRYLSSKSL